MIPVTGYLSRLPFHPQFFIAPLHNFYCMTLPQTLLHALPQSSPSTYTSLVRECDYAFDYLHNRSAEVISSPTPSLNHPLSVEKVLGLGLSSTIPSAFQPSPPAFDALSVEKALNLVIPSALGLTIPSSLPLAFSLATPSALPASTPSAQPARVDRKLFKFGCHKTN